MPKYLIIKSCNILSIVYSVLSISKILCVNYNKQNQDIVLTVDR